MMGLSLIPLPYKLGAIAVTVVAIAGYIAFLKIEIMHYKADRDAIEREFTDYKEVQEEQAKVLQSRLKIITERAGNLRSKNIALDQKVQAKMKEELQIVEQHKELADTKLPDDIIGVYNSSTDEADIAGTK